MVRKVKSVIWIGCVLALTAHSAEEKQVTWNGLFGKVGEVDLLHFHPSTANRELLEHVKASVEEDLGQIPRNGKKIRVLGGGPVGLITAVEAAMQGFEVEVFEKRKDYTRSIWFDYYSPPWSSAIAWLERLGFHRVGREGVDWECHEGFGREVVEVRTMRCQSLERFLSMLAFGLNVTLHYGVSPSLEELGSLQDTSIIIDASGANSNIPSSCDVVRGPPKVLTWNQIDMQGIKLPLQNKMGALRQMTWLATLSNCKTDFPKNDPFFPSMEHGLEQVTSLFQRNFSDVCEVQALFQTSVGRDDAENLVEQILQHFDGQVIQEELFFIEIGVVESPIGLNCSWTNSPVVFVGDSALNSYYRMGVGLHKAFFELEILADLLRSFAKSGTLDLGYVEKLEESQHFWASYEASVMAIEASCGYFVGFSLDANNLESAATAYMRDSHGEYFDLSRNNIVNCLEKTRSHLPMNEKDEL